MFNSKIRDAMRRYGFYSYQVAAAVGKSETSFSRSLRNELPAVEQAAILDAIEKMAEQREKQRKLEVR